MLKIRNDLFLRCWCHSEANSFQLNFPSVTVNPELVIRHVTASSSFPRICIIEGSWVKAFFSLFPKAVHYAVSSHFVKHLSTVAMTVPLLTCTKRTKKEHPTAVHTNRQKRTTTSRPITSFLCSYKCITTCKEAEFVLSFTGKVLALFTPPISSFHCRFVGESSGWRKQLAYVHHNEQFFSAINYGFIREIRIRVNIHWISVSRSIWHQ